MLDSSGILWQERMCHDVRSPVVPAVGKISFLESEVLNLMSFY